MAPKRSKPTKKDIIVRRSTRSASASPAKSTMANKGVSIKASKTVKIDECSQEPSNPSPKSRHFEVALNDQHEPEISPAEDRYSPPSTPIKGKARKSSLGKRRNVEPTSDIQYDTDDLSARSPKKIRITSHNKLEAPFAPKSITPAKIRNPAKTQGVAERIQDEDSDSDVMIVSDVKRGKGKAAGKHDAGLSESDEESVIKWSDSEAGYTAPVIKNHSDRGKQRLKERHASKFREPDTDDNTDVPSDTPSYIPSNRKTVYDLEKGNHQLALPKNSQCEILTAFNNADRESGSTGVFIDPIMRKSYKGLAPLPILTFVRFNGEEANNPIFLPTTWRDSFPNLDLEWLVTGLRFKSDGNFVNLARIDPSELVAVKSGTKGRRICHSGGASSSLSTSAVCISLVQVTSCHIIDPFTTGGGQIIKNISGLHHSLENERLQACCCVVFGARGMQAPIRDGVLTFGTRPEKQVAPSVGSSNLLSPVRPKIHQSIELSKARDWVKYSDDVPIYDARFPIVAGKSNEMSSKSTITPDFSFTSHSIKRIPSIYSTYYKGNEVPSGSLAMVGYTMGCYEKEGELVAAPNLNWVVVIAADD